MEATHAPTAIAGGATARRTAVGRFFRGACSFVAEVLVDGARGRDLERILRTSPGAQFGALSNSAKERLLNRGYRP